MCVSCEQERRVFLAVKAFSALGLTLSKHQRVISALRRVLLGVIHYAMTVRQEESWDASRTLAED